MKVTERLIDNDYVFGNSKNKHWTYTSLNRYIKKNINDINGLRLHRIRCTVETLSEEGGASLYEFMQLLGYSQT
ncbi:hypothetical protein [Clostridium sp. BJN0013]|uniref:hypothetical protein n=1 Tax=Clostridium sp. BJN0013 TaxID=3236840 RepID=UPI0034C5DF0C